MDATAFQDVTTTSSHRCKSQRLLTVNLRLVPALALLPLLLGACGSSVNDVSITNTTAPAKSDSCSDYAFPIASLSTEKDSQNGASVETQWRDPDGCTVSAHPYDTMFIPTRPVTVGSGQNALVSVDPSPDSMGALAWTPDLTGAIVGDETTEIRLDGLNAERRKSHTTVVPLDLDGSLRLKVLGTGEWVVHVGGTWPNGRRSFAFRVVIE